MGGQNTFEVDGSRERDPVGGPSGSVGHEVLGLRRAARSGRACRVVRAAYDMGNGRIIQVILEERVDERCNLWSYIPASVRTDVEFSDYIAAIGDEGKTVLNLCRRSLGCTQTERPGI